MNTNTSTRGIEFIATVHNGHLPQQTREQIAELCRNAEGKKLRVQVSEARALSSNPQKRYYFSVIVESIREMFLDAGTNVSKDEMHEWLKEHVGKLFKEIITPDGEVTQIVRSYAGLDTREAENYHTLCRQWAAERRLDIAEPGEDA